MGKCQLRNTDGRTEFFKSPPDKCPVKLQARTSWFRKGRGTRDQIANTRCIIKKQGNSRKISASASLTTLKPLTVWITTLENSSRDGSTRPPDLPPEKPECRSRSNS